MPLSKSVSGWASFSFAEICPNSVFNPVFTASAVAVPLITFDPMNSILQRAASVLSAAIAPVFFSTGKVSPVNAASLVKSSFDDISWQSAGITSPAFSATISPGTICFNGISANLPSLNTLAVISTNDNSFFTASPALFSCQNPSILLMPTMMNIMIASVGSPRNSDRVEAPSNISVIGLLNCWRNSFTSL